MADTCTKPAHQAPIPPHFPSIFARIRKIKTNGPNTDRYYGHHHIHSVEWPQPWQPAAYGTARVAGHSHSPSDSYILHKSNKIRCVFLPFLPFIFFGFSYMRAARAFGKRPRQPGSAASVHSVIYTHMMVISRKRPSMVAHMRLLQIHIFDENVYKNGHRNAITYYRRASTLPHMLSLHT